MSKQGTPTFKLSFCPNYRFHILGPGEWENEASAHLADWVAVVDDQAGIIAYFGSEDDASLFLRAIRSAYDVDHIGKLFYRAETETDNDRKLVGG